MRFTFWAIPVTALLVSCYESAVTRDDWTGSISSSANTTSNSSSVGGNSSSSSIVNGISSSSATNSSSSISTNSSSIAVPVLNAQNPNPTTNSLPTLSWNLVNGASKYTIQISTNSAFSTTVIDTTIYGTNMTPSFNLPLGTVYWRVRSDLSSNAWSQVSSFSISCGAKLGDSRDKQLYNTVQIGTQCWMAQNLNYAKSTGEAGNSWCYDNNTTNCTTYGRLYDWSAVMAGASSSNTIPSGVRGICPNGWHVPSDEEWKMLINAVGGACVSGKKIKTTQWGGDDSYLFSAMPSGSRYDDGTFNLVGEFAWYWSSIQENSTNSWHRVLSSSRSDLYQSSTTKKTGLSLRCLKD